ncbi:MAG: hypothetical protein QXK06_00070 [Candidatus Diapherotrites archaeon]
MLILIILFFFGILLLLPPVIMLLFPIANLLMRILLAFLILTTVRGYVGNGALSLVISGALIYLLVIKWGYVTASLYVFFYVLLAFQFLGVIVWGTNSLIKPRR